MRKQFLDQLIKQFSNDMELGKAVRAYYWLRDKRFTKEDCEKQILGSTFNNNNNLL
jgi:hypothetical protein